MMMIRIMMDAVTITNKTSNNNHTTDDTKRRAHDNQVPSCVCDEVQVLSPLEERRRIINRMHARPSSPKCPSLLQNGSDRTIVLVVGSGKFKFRGPRGDVVHPRPLNASS